MNLVVEISEEKALWGRCDKYCVSTTDGAAIYHYRVAHSHRQLQPALKKANTVISVEKEEVTASKIHKV